MHNILIIKAVISAKGTAVIIKAAISAKGTAAGDLRQETLPFVSLFKLQNTFASEQDSSPGECNKLLHFKQAKLQSAHLLHESLT